MPGTARSALISLPKASVAPRGIVKSPEGAACPCVSPNTSGFTPKRSRTSHSALSARSSSAKANMPVKRPIASSTPHASQAASMTSVSEWPRKAGAC